MIDGSKVIEFFGGLYTIEEEIKEQKEDMNAQLKAYAENIDISPKALKSAFALYKKYRDGKNSQEDCSTYAELSNIVEDFFANARVTD